MCVDQLGDADTDRARLGGFASGGTSARLLVCPSAFWAWFCSSVSCVLTAEERGHRKRAGSVDVGVERVSKQTLLPVFHWLKCVALFKKRLQLHGKGTGHGEGSIIGTPNPIYFNKTLSSAL